MSRSPRTPRARFGSVDRLPSGRYRARYRLPDGSRHSVPGTFGTRTEAANALTKVHAAVLTGNVLSVTPSAVTVGDYLRTYLDDHAATLRPRTLDYYRRTAERWILRPIGLARPLDLSAVKLSDMSPALVRTWWTGLLEHTRAEALTAPETYTGPRPRRGAHPARIWARANGWDVATNGRIPTDALTAWEAAGRPEPAPQAPATEHAGRTAASAAYRLLRQVMNQAESDGLLASNPVRIKGASSAPHPERRPLTASEVARLAEAVPDRYRAAVLVAAWSGLRPGEVFGLRRQDVDLEAGTLTVARTLVEVPGKPLDFGPPKTSAGRRTVSLPASITAALSVHLENHTGTDPEALVFTTGHGNPVSGSARATVLRHARAVIGRPDISWHHLRHTGATLAAQAGATQAELQARIGHSSFRAAALYQHAAADRDRDLAARLEDFLTPKHPSPAPAPRPPEPQAPAPAASVPPVAEATNTPATVTVLRRRGHLALVDVS